MSKADADATSRLRVEWLTNQTELQSIEKQWKSLEERVHDRTVLATYDFLATWYGRYAGEYGGAPLIGLAWRGSELAGVAPLTMRRGSIGKVPVTRVDFAPNDSPVGAFLVEDDHPETAGSLLSSLIQSHKFDVA